MNLKRPQNLNSFKGFKTKLFKKGEGGGFHSPGPYRVKEENVDGSLCHNSGIENDRWIHWRAVEGIERHNTSIVLYQLTLCLHETTPYPP